MLDVNLKGHRSHAVADALTARGVFFSTGNSGQHIMDGYGDRAVLRKPFKYDALSAILTGLISR